jgi:RNA polymerase sigma factor (sigma-70 family)
MTVVAHAASHEPLPAAVAERPAPPAFDDIFSTLFIPAMRVAYRLTGDRGLAEDVAAEAMVRAYASWRKVQRLPYLEAWVMRVATNVAIDMVRRRQTTQHVQDALDVVASRGLGETTAFDDLVVTRLALVAALDRLPTRQRDAVALRYLGGLSDEEVALAMGIAPSSVRTHVQRALQQLRDRLSTHAEVRHGD